MIHWLWKFCKKKMFIFFCVSKAASKRKQHYHRGWEWIIWIWLRRGITISATSASCCQKFAAAGLRSCWQEGKPTSAALYLPPAAATWNSKVVSSRHQTLLYCQQVLELFNSIDHCWNKNSRDVNFAWNCVSFSSKLLCCFVIMAKWFFSADKRLCPHF